MSVEWNGGEFLAAMRQAVAKGLTETALAAENIARRKMPPAPVAVKTGGKGGTVYAKAPNSSDPLGYPAHRTSALRNSLTTSVATPDNLRAAFGVFDGARGPGKFVLGQGARGYPSYLEFKPVSRGGRRWARRTINENVELLAATFRVAAKREFARAAPR